MKVPAPVLTRQRAILAELGIDPKIVIRDSFDSKGCTLVGPHRELGKLIMSDGQIITTKYEWPTPKISARAVTARDEDFAETFGLDTPNQHP